MPSRAGSGAFGQQNLKENLALQRQQRITQEALTRGVRPKERHRTSSSGVKSVGVRSLITQGSPIEKVTATLLGGLGCVAYGPLLLAATLFTGYGLLSLWKEPTVVEVADHHWVRSIAIETYQKQSKSDWKDSVPGDANNVSCSRRQKDTKKVADGKTCSTRQVDQGDGTFREERSCETTYRSEPIYGSYCSYTVNRWSSGGATSVASGNSLADIPQWPNPTYKSCSSTQLGCQRQDKRTETYTLRLIDTANGKEHTCKVSYPEWHTTPIGTQFDAKVGKLVGGVNCKRMQRR
ncbi:MAG: hypothetical protein AAGA46_07685 [Cyanobacteria bacterium P01_F01_bin.13]